MNEQRFPGDGGAQPSKGLGAFYGVLATVASFIVGSFVGVVLLVVITSFIEGGRILRPGRRHIGDQGSGASHPHRSRSRCRREVAQDTRVPHRHGYHHRD